MIATPALARYRAQRGASVRVVTSMGGNALYFLSSDHLGSSSLTTDASGNVLARQLYDACGNIRSGGGLPTDIGYTSQRLDSGTNLVFMHARFYSSVSGRFVSADTMVTDPKNPQSLNRFSYVYNNPLKHIDPSGHCVKDDAVCLAYQKYLHDTYSIDLQDSLERAWTAYEAKLVYEAIYDIATKFSKEIPYKDSTELIKAAFGGTALMRNVGGLLFKRRATTLGKLIIFPDHSPENGLWETADEAWTKSVIVHELGHAWDNDEDLGGISQGLKSQVGKTSCMLIVICSYNPNAKGEAPVGTYAENGPHEDWAMSFAQYVEPYSGGHQPAWRNLGPLREQYVRVQIALLVTKEP